MEIKNQTVGTHYHIYLFIGVTRFPKENDFPADLKMKAIPFTRCTQVYMLWYPFLCLAWTEGDGVGQGGLDVLDLIAEVVGKVEEHVRATRGIIDHSMNVW